MRRRRKNRRSIQLTEEEEGKSGKESWKTKDGEEMKENEKPK